MLEEFKSKNSNFDIIILNNSSNKEIAYSHNKLINNCATNYFYFLNGNDSLTKLAMKRFNDSIRARDYDLILTKAIIHLNKVPFYGRYLNKRLNKDSNNHAIDFLKRNPFYVWNKLINLKFYKSFKY